MATAARTAFGELVYRHRRRLGLTRWQLAQLSHDIAATDPPLRPISERTIAAIERRVTMHGATRTPQPSTVATLARLFGLETGSLDHRKFVGAAGATFRSRRRAGGSPSEPPAVFLDAGREQHLNRIDIAVDAAVAGAPGILLVGADAGTGKTSLIAEAGRRALSRHPGLTVLWTRAISRFGIGPSYEPFRQMLGLMVGDHDTLGPAELLSERNTREITRRIPTAIGSIVSDGQPLIGWLMPVTYLSLPQVRAAIDDDLRARLDSAIRYRSERDHEPATADLAIARLLAGYTAAGPVMLVVDDLHWADPGTIAAIHHLSGALERMPVPLLILGAYRPGEIDDTGSPLAGLLGTIEHATPDAIVDLSTAVGGDAGRAFVDAMLSGWGLGGDPDVAAALFERTAGLPYFVVSYLRLLQDQDDDARLDVGDTIPSGIEAVFAQQMYRLAPETQTLLAAASVQGDSFLTEPLARMLELTTERLADLVDSRLVNRFRLVREAGRATIAGVTVHRYDFSHALLREYLYTNLTELQRRHFHRATAEAMIDIFGTGPHDGAQLIAMHLDRAGDPLRAAPAYDLAGIHGLLTRDYERAGASFDRILELDVEATATASHINGIIGLGNTARGLGHTTAARERLEDALNLAERNRLPVNQAQALESLAMVDFDDGDAAGGAARLAAAIERYLVAGMIGDAARATSNRSNLLHSLGRYEEAITLADRAASTAAATGNDRTWVDARNARAICLIELGLFEEALEIYRECIEVCTRKGFAHQELLCWLNAGLA